MSRSRKNTPKRAYDGIVSEKIWKVMWHQKMRAVTRQRLYRCDPDGVVLPHEREVFSDWDFGRSARIWFDPRQYSKWMRK